MKKKYALIVSLAIYFFAAHSIIAQSTIDVSGTYEGVRKQFNTDHTDFIQEFQYRYDLVQTGNQIEGVSTIYDENGHYGEIKIRGIVTDDNKLYFEEYEIVDQIKDDHKLWCFKAGVLDIVQTKNELLLQGETASFMAGYGYRCTGGYTEMYKTDYTCEDCNQGVPNDKINNFSFTVYPSPAVLESSIHFTIDKKSNVDIQVYDLSGKNVRTVFSGNMKAGSQKMDIDLSDVDPGMYVVSLSINNMSFTKQIIKTSE